MMRETVIARIALMQAWLNGAAIQFETVCGWKDTTNPAWCASETYRIKPQVVRSRRALLGGGDDSEYHVYIVNSPGPSVTGIETMPYFVRWIDNDWVETEI